MRYLLDTHIWIWSLVRPEQLGEGVRTALADQKNELWLSSVSVWEFLTLARKGRLQVSDTPERWLAKALSLAPLREAPVTHAIAMQSQLLELPHWDPADRFIAATSRQIEATLITADQRLLAAPGLSVLANS